MEMEVFSEEKEDKSNSNILSKNKPLSFEELKKRDIFGAFDEFLSVNKAKEQGVIPAPWHSIFKDKCNCGSDMIIKKSLTQVLCCNPRCKYKVANIMAEMFANYGCRNLGYSSCLDMLQMDSSKVYSPISFLITDMNRYNSLGGSKYTDILNAKNIMFNTPTTLAGMVSNMALPGIGNGLSVVLRYYDSVDYMIEDFQKRGIDTCLREFNIASSMKHFYVREYLSDIYYASKIFYKSIRPVGDITWKVCVTGVVAPEGKYMSRNDFITYLNELSIVGDGIKLFEINLCSGPMNATYVVADSPSNNDKYMKAMRRAKETGRTDFLVTATELVQKIKSEVKAYNGGEQKPIN